MKPHTPHAVFPTTIRQLQYVGPLGGLVKASHFQFGLYQDQQGQEYVCKLWSGKRHDQHARALINEIQAYQALMMLMKKQTRTLQRSFPDVHVPKLYASQVGTTQAYFVVEKIPGELLSKQDSQTILKAYERLVPFFQALSSPKLLSGLQITKRHTWQYFVLFHIYFTLAVIKHPRHIGQLLTALGLFYRGALSLATDAQAILVHRDLGGTNNVFIHKNELYVLDFEILTVTHRLVQIANIVVTKWKNKAFVRDFFRSPMFAEITTNTNTTRAFAGLLAYGAIVDLGTGLGRIPRDSFATITKAGSL